MTQGPILLELKQVTRKFGGLVAVNQLDMQIYPNTIHGLIGPNGAGKSTAFDLISGLTALTSGAVYLEGRDMTRVSVEDRVQAGICRTFQTPKLFEKMTAHEVVMTGRHLHGRTGILGSMFSIQAKRKDEHAIAESAFELLKFVGLQEQFNQVVADLPYGKRRLVEIARALATEPKILLLDEVASGLNPVETKAVGDLIEKLPSRGITVVLVEHDMRFVMRLCGVITVLNFGAKIVDGTPAEISTNQDVIQAYLGQPRSAEQARRTLRKKSVKL
ncbi:MAG: ABC transporter ATP-binding protein [Alcaligenaceae bacterium]